MINRKNLLLLLRAYGVISLLFTVAMPAKAERFYDETGKYQGRVQDNGRIYDEQGRYQGRIERNRLYDEAGEYRGRIQGSVVFDEHDETTGATMHSDEFYRMHRGYFPEDYRDE